MRENAAWVCDLTFEARLDRPNWLVVDHHTTDVTPKQAQLVHDVEKSAGLLCYELCQQHGLGSPELDRLVHLNNVSDLFLEDDPDFVMANDYANLVKIYQFWNLLTLLDGKIERLLDHPLLEVMAVKRRIEDPIGLAWCKANLSGITPTIGYMDTVLGNTNLIMHQLLEERKTSYTVLVTLMRRANGTIIASFRSKNGEALKVAEKLQGGGHANAAGATLPRSVRTIVDGVDYLRKLFNTSPAASSPLNNLESLFASLEVKKG